MSAAKTLGNLRLHEQRCVTPAALRGIGGGRAVLLGQAPGTVQVSVDAAWQLLAAKATA